MKYIAMSLAVLLGFSACTDLDVAPMNILTDDQVLGNASGVESYLARVYGEMPMEDFRYSYYYLYNCFWTTRYTDGLTGWGICPNYSGKGTEETTPNVEYTGVGARDAFGDQYKLIRELNYFLATIDNYASNYTTEQLNTWKGEMYCLRAFTYYEMVKRFGGVPIVLDAVDPAGKTNDEVNQARDSEEDCWKQISSDYDQAINLLPETSPERGRVNKYVAFGLKARAMVHAGSIAKYNTISYFDDNTQKRVCGMDEGLARDFYQQAYDAAKAVEGHYSLYKGEWQADNRDAQYQNYFHIFTDVTNPEIMLAREYSYPNDAHGYNAYMAPNQYINGGSYGCKVCPTLEYVELFDGIPLDANGHIDVYNADGTYKLYDKPMDLFATAEPRLRATVVLPNDELSGSTCEVWRGIYTGQDAATGKIQRLISDGETRKYEGIPEISGKIVTSVSRSQTAYTLHDGTKMNPAGQSGKMANESYNLTGFSVRKFVSETLNETNVIENHDDDPWIELRYAEVLLVRAEAAAELASLGDNSKLSDAYDCINQIRERAGANLLVDSEKASASTFIETVRKERRKELAFENKIWWDEKRWRTLDKEQVNRTYRVLFPFYADYAGKWFFDARYDETPYIFTFNSSWYYQEIPANAITSSDNLIVQNPGY